MNISPIGSNAPITRLQGSKATESTSLEGPQDAGTTADTVEISDSARYLAEIKKLPDIRDEKVQAARDLIASGQIDSPDRLNGTVDALMKELA
jgi:hypothetical protein